MATLYMRADGTAANKAAATGPASSAAACMSMATHNSTGTGSLSSGDTVILSSQGGDFTAGLVPQWSGVTYQAATGESPKIRTSTKIASGSSWTDVGDTKSGYIRLFIEV